MNHVVRKGERYYQEIAVNSAVEAILKGRKRLLLTMATGTGKTAVAFQICWKLWNSRWNRTVNRPSDADYRKPKILYLADRNVLVDQPKDGLFAAFDDARWKIEGGVVNLGREMYFAIYQAIAKDERRPGLYKEFLRGFFDLVIVDECHRGSARDDSNWREILMWFEPAYQLGMTATPLRDDNRDTYLYFGNPLYTYSLRQGIEDGFLAPYRVHRVISEWDAAGWRPSKADLDRYGRSIPDEEYQTKDFERSVALRACTEAVARHLTEFLKKTDRFAKTIVFCVDQEHADEIRRALNNLNSDLAAQFPDYVCRVTSDEGDFGRGHLGRFQDVETQTPTILTTSQLLTTGVDAPTCKNVVLARVIGSMSEFKQIIGRGTRVRDDYGKLWFDIIDYTGSATRLFADPSFHGDPALLTEEELEDGGKSTIIRMKIKQGFDRTTCRGCLRTSGGGWVLCIGAGALVKSSKFSAAQTNVAVLAVIGNRWNAECIGQNERLQGTTLMAARITIEEVYKRSEQGVLRPFLCRGSDGETYFVKGRGAGYRSLIGEEVRNSWGDTRKLERGP